MSGVPAFHRVEAGGDGAGQAHLESFGGERFLAQKAKALVVIDDQTLAFMGVPLCERQKVKQNRAPDAVGSRIRSPPWARAMLRDKRQDRCRPRSAFRSRTASNRFRTHGGRHPGTVVLDAQLGIVEPRSTLTKILPDGLSGQRVEGIADRDWRMTT